MIALSISEKGALGFKFGIIPNVDPAATGSIAGIVGAGGNVGAVIFGLGFRQLNYHNAFVLMGCSVLGSSILTLFIVVKNHAGILFGKDAPVLSKSQTLVVPTPNADKADDVKSDEEAEGPIDVKEDKDLNVTTDSLNANDEGLEEIKA